MSPHHRDVHIFAASTSADDKRSFQLSFSVQLNEENTRLGKLAGTETWTIWIIISSALQLEEFRQWKVKCAAR